MARGRSGSIQLELNEDDESEETKTRWVNADAVTYSIQRDWRLNKLGYAVLGAIALLVAWLYTEFEWWIALGGAVVLGFVFVAVCPWYSGSVLGTITQRYEFDPESTNNVERQFTVASYEYVTHEREWFAGLGNRIWRLHVNPDRLVSMEHRRGREDWWFLVPLVLGAGGAYATDRYLDDVRLTALVGVVAVVTAFLLWAREYDDDHLELAFESGESRTLAIPTEEAGRIIDEARTRGVGQSGDTTDERLLSASTGSKDVHVNVDAVTDTRALTGSLNWAAYAAALAVGLGVLGVGAYVDWPLVGAGLGLGAGLAVLAYLYPRDTIMLRTLASTHSFRAADLTGFVEDFTERSRGYVRLSDEVTSPLRTVDYDYHVVTENVVDMAYDEWDLRLLLALLAGAFVAVAVTAQQVADGADPTLAWTVGLLAAVGAVVVLVARIVRAFGPPAVRFAYPNGATRTFELTDADASAAREALSREAETVSLENESAVGRERGQVYNLENVVTVESASFEFDPVGGVVCWILALPIILLFGAYFPVWIPVAVGVALMGYALWTYRKPRHVVTTPLERRSLSGSEAETFFEELDAVAVDHDTATGRNGGMFVKRDYSVAFLGDNVVSVEQHVGGAFSALLSLVGHVSALGLALLHSQDIWPIAIDLVGGLVGRDLAGVLAGLVVLLVLGITFLISMLFLETNERLRLELPSGDTQNLRVNKDDAESLRRTFA